MQSNFGSTTGQIGQNAGRNRIGADQHADLDGGQVKVGLGTLRVRFAETGTNKDCDFLANCCDMRLQPPRTSH